MCTAAQSARQSVHMPNQFGEMLRCDAILPQAKICPNPQIITSSVLASQPARLTAKSCQLCRNVTRVPARLRCVLAACRAKNVTRILPSCDDGLPRYQDQVLLLDAQDQHGDAAAAYDECSTAALATSLCPSGEQRDETRVLQSR